MPVHNGGTNTKFFICNNTGIARNFVLISVETLQVVAGLGTVG